MSENKLEGTFSLDGLLEGRFAGDSFTADDLRSWAAKAAERHLNFSIETDGNAFSVLGERRAVQTGELGEELSRAVADAIEDLLRAMPPPTRTGAMSTLRSVEYRKNEEVQTLYVLVGGHVDIRQRTVEAKTTAPLPPLTRAQKIRMILTGLAVVLLVFAVSSIFVPYRQLYHDAINKIIPVSADDITVGTGPFAKSFTLEKKEVIRGGQRLVLTFKRTDAFPVTPAQQQKLYDDANSLPTRLAAESLARGYVRAECFDKDGKFIQAAMVRIAGLRDNKTLKVSLPLPVEGPRAVKIDITY